MKPKIVVVVGPTASGKSSLGESLALHFNGEIISADSRQVYRGLDLGSGKEKLQVEQRLIDIVDAGERFTAADWKKLAEREIESLLKQGKLPVVVGGTSLYVSSLIDNYQFAPEADTSIKAEIMGSNTEDLVSYLRKSNPEVLVGLDIRNRRYLERAVEKTRCGWRSGQKGESIYDALVLQPDWPREKLYRRIDQRLDDRLEQGLVQEVRGLIERGVSVDWLRSLGLEYRYYTDYIEGRYKTIDEATQALKYATHSFARRQLMWWRRRDCQLIPEGNPAAAIKVVADWRADSI